MIVCLGWGSLVWTPRTLPVRLPWRLDGPMVRVEFVRESQDKRITLVLDESALPVPSLWASMMVDSIEQAKRELARREEIPAKNISVDIGSWSAGTPEPSNPMGLAAWSESRGIEQVVWTGLAAKFAGTKGRHLTGNEVVQYLSVRTGDERALAEEYVRRAPSQVDTAYRRLIAERVGWSANDGPPNG